MNEELEIEELDEGVETEDSVGEEYAGEEAWEAGDEGLDESYAKPKKQKRGTGGILLGGIATILLVLLAAGILYYRGEAERAKEAVAAMAEVQMELYTWEEMEVQIGKAVQAALEEAEQQALEESLMTELPGSDDVLLQIQESLSEGKGLLETLRPLYPEHVIVYTGGKYQFFPIHFDLRMNPYDAEGFRTTEKGELQYLENEEVVSHKGIDVSKHQGKIDWKKVRGDGIEFAIIRVGMRGYGSGKVVADERYEENVKGAISNGIKTGVYFFSQAITVEEAVEEAQFVIEKIAPYRVDGPVVFDVEKVQDSSARMNALTPAERTDVALAFLEEIEKAGYHPMIYCNTETGIALLEPERLDAYEKWFAYYGTEHYYPYDYSIWQYSDKGRVSGISEKVDLNIALRIWE